MLRFFNTNKEKYNQEHHITPTSIKKEIGEELVITKAIEEKDTIQEYEKMTLVEKRSLVKTLEEQMRKASRDLNFEEAMMLRDIILEIKTTMR